MSLVVALRPTLARWWTAYQRKITTWETYRKLLTVRFGNDTRGMDSLYDGFTYPALHVKACKEA